jgi:hypothetical protein
MNIVNSISPNVSKLSKIFAQKNDKAIMKFFFSNQKLILEMFPFFLTGCSSNHRQKNLLMVDQFVLLAIRLDFDVILSIKNVAKQKCNYWNTV